MDKSKKTKSSRKKADGLWTPNIIMNIPGLDASCKLLLAHFYSFGTKGCYQSNRTLAEIFMTSEYTISRKIKKLSKYISKKNPKGYYRTIWVRFHPEVSESIRIFKEGKKIINKLSGQNKSSSLRQKCRTDLGTTGRSTAAKQLISLRQKRLTTNTEINKETNKETAADLPLPAHRQASRLLEQRNELVAGRIAQLRKSFGKPKAERMPPEEFEKRRQMIIKQLRSGL